MNKAASKIALIGSTAVVFALPLVTSAATIGNLSQAGSFIIDTINNILVPIVFALAFIVFVWGAFTTFILGAGSEEVKEKGKNLMLWGLVGFFVMLSVWGLVNVLTGTIQFGGGNTGPNGGLPKAGTTIMGG